MHKKLNKYLAVGIAILIADLINAYFFLVMDKYKSAEIPYRSTAIQMIVSIIIYYPLITYFEKFYSKGTKDILKNSTKVVEHRYWGPIAAFVAFFCVIWIILVRIWYDRDLFEDIGNWIESYL